MATEFLDSEADSPGYVRRPVAGLRLRALPSCGQPEFPVEHPYFELVYGPVIGPSAFMVARNLGRRLRAAEGLVTACPIEVARETGLRASHGEPVGRKSQLVKTIARLQRHQLVRPDVDGVLGVVVAVPPIPTRWLDQIPATALAAHQEFLAPTSSDGGH